MHITNRGSSMDHELESPSTHRERGAFEVEFIIVAALIMVMVGAVGSMVLAARRAQRFVDLNSSVTTTTQDVMEYMRGELGSATHLFEWDIWGFNYLTNLDIGSKPLLSGRRLPWIDVGGVFNNDAVLGVYKTGNTLLYSIQDRTDSFDVAPGETVRTNIYRIVCWYLTKIPGKNHIVDNDAFDLVHWVSEPLADWDSVDKVTDPAKKLALVNHLYNGTNPSEPAYPYPVTRLLWKHGQDDWTTAFNLIQSDGSTVAPPAGWKIPANLDSSQLDGLLGYKRMAIASNSAGSARGVHRYASWYDAADGYPHGLEVQIIGPASARQVLLHLTICSQNDGAEQAFMDLQGIVDTRDL